MKSLKLIQSDSYLQPFAEAIEGRYNYALQREKELTSGVKLSDWANGHMYYGLHKVGKKWIIREWAPNATAIYLVGDCNGWQKDEAYRLQPVENGVWEATFAEEMLEHLGIPGSQRIRQMSKGTREKVQLIATMSRRAKLYLLDEPIGGVDPAARDYILNTIINNYDPQATVIISTHLIADVEQVLDDFMFLTYGGNIISAGNAEQIRQNTGKSLDALFREVFKCSKSY
mgnify:CR=1 FL=1